MFASNLESMESTLMIAVNYESKSNNILIMIEWSSYIIWDNIFTKHVRICEFLKIKAIWNLIVFKKKRFFTVLPLAHSETFCFCLHRICGVSNKIHWMVSTPYNYLTHFFFSFFRLRLFWLGTWNLGTISCSIRHTILKTIPPKISENCSLWV